LVKILPEADVERIIQNEKNRVKEREGLKIRIQLPSFQSEQIKLKEE
jgi:hypothetical protein